MDHTVHLPVMSERVYHIRYVTAADPTLSLLYNMVLEGWPLHKEDIPISLIPYCDYRDELVQDHLLFKGH